MPEDKLLQPHFAVEAQELHDRKQELARMASPEVILQERRRRSREDTRERRRKAKRQMLGGTIDPSSVCWALAFVCVCALACRCALGSDVLSG